MTRRTTPKTPKIDTSDWRNLPLDAWNVRTVQAYFIDCNRELFGIETYLPMRNWSFEQAQIKRALTAYGSATLRLAFDEIFRSYRPTREYPILTAGFAISYRLNAVLPRILAESQRKETQETAAPINVEEVADWL